MNSSFSPPCPPGLDVPPEVFSPFTTNNLKVGVRNNLCSSHPSSPLSRSKFQRVASSLCPPVPAVAGLLCPLLVPLLHAGGHPGPPGARPPLLPAPETGRRPSPQGARERRGGGVFVRGRLQRGRGERLRGGVAGGGGLPDQRDDFQQRAAGRLDVGQKEDTPTQDLASPLPPHRPSNLGLKGPDCRVCVSKCVAFSLRRSCRLDPDLVPGTEA